MFTRLTRHMFLSAQVHIYDALGSYMLNLTLFAGEEGEPITIAGVDWCESIPSAHARTHVRAHPHTRAHACKRARTAFMMCACMCCTRVTL